MKKSNMKSSKCNLLKSLSNSSSRGFVRYASLLSFKDEIGLLREYGVKDSLIDKLETCAVKNTINNLSALIEADIKYWDSSDVCKYEEEINWIKNYCESNKINFEEITDDATKTKYKLFN